jgi:hypothetical protein
MDGVKSTGMPVSLPLTQAPEWTPYGVSREARRVASSGGGIRNSGDSTLPASGGEEQEMRIAKDFESVLLTKLFDQVQASIEDSGFDDEDSGGQQVRGMFWLYLAQDVADKGGLGLWKDIYQHIKQMEGAANPAGSVDEEL